MKNREGGLPQNTILQGDSIEFLEARTEPFADLVFADPPYNIGYQYDVYDDSRDAENYLAWSRRWMRQVYRALKPTGTFWLAIGDEYAAEMKLIAQKELGFTCRSWIIWYYTFGVNCSHKFSRSHAHLFYFVKTPEKFTFRKDDLDNRVPSARQLVYADKRADPNGRLPDDTWIIRPADMAGELTSDESTWTPTEINNPVHSQQSWTLRPQDLRNRFKPDEDTWYFPRVAGTFKERAGFHGCQMPEQLLGRIIRTCSNQNDLVLDPFSGSATTLAVAKKLGRRYLGLDVSADYVKHGSHRLASVCVGDRLDGSAEPLLSAPRTDAGSKKGSSKQSSRRSSKKSGGPNPDDAERLAKQKRYSQIQLELTLQGICEAFRLTRDGFSADRLVADPQLNANFIEACNTIGLAGDARSWNILLFRLRKAGKLVHLATTRRTKMSWDDCDAYWYASEIALQQMLDDVAESVDEVMCDPALAAKFDQIAARFAPGFEPLQYRWAALKLRKGAKLARSRAAVITPPAKLGKAIPLRSFQPDTMPPKPGIYIIGEGQHENFYVGEALNLQSRLQAQFKKVGSPNPWSQLSPSLQIQTLQTEINPANILSWQSCLAAKYKPKLNFQELWNATE